MRLNTRKNYTQRSRFTRMCISEAIIELLEKQEYENIKISDIVRKTGISRMTFYKYYHTKEEALEDYLHEIVEQYVKECEKNMVGRFHDSEHIFAALLYFDKYAKFFLTMYRNGKYSVLIDAVNAYMLAYISPRYHGSIYDLYFYAGALLNIFIKWEDEGKTQTARNIANTICSGFEKFV